MLRLAFALLCIAALLGGGLAVAYLRAKPLPAVLPLVHGATGAASLAVLLLVLRRGLPPTDMGTTGFGPTAAALLAVALAFGLRLGWLAWRRRRPSELVVGAHAGFAIAGLVVLLTLVTLG